MVGVEDGVVDDDAGSAGAGPLGTGSDEARGPRVAGWLLVAAAVALLPATSGASLLAAPLGAAALVHANRRREAARDAAALALRQGGTRHVVAPPEPWTAASADVWLRQVARPVDGRGR